MMFQNYRLTEEIYDVFERIHARLDSRCQQLIRKTKFQNETTLVFTPMNQRQLEENIDGFGRLIVSTSLNNIDRCESVCLDLAFHHCFFTLFVAFFLHIQ